MCFSSRGSNGCIRRPRRCWFWASRAATSPVIVNASRSPWSVTLSSLLLLDPLGLCCPSNTIPTHLDLDRAFGSSRDRASTSTLSFSTSELIHFFCHQRPCRSVEERSAPTIPADLALEPVQYGAAEPVFTPRKLLSPLMPATLLPDRPMPMRSCHSRRPISQRTSCSPVDQTKYARF